MKLRKKLFCITHAKYQLFSLALSLMVLVTLSPSQVKAQDQARALWDLYKQGQFEEVELQGKALLNTGTESGSILLAVGRSLADLLRPSEALFFLQRAMASDHQKTWVYAWAQVYLGKCRYDLDEVELAREAWVLARDCGATKNATNEAISYLNYMGLSESFAKWPIQESEHFLFHFSPRLIDVDRELFAQQHELVYNYVTTWFGGGPDRKIRFFIWQDQEEAHQAGIPQLGFSLAENYLIHARVDQTVGHEMTHVISHHAVNPVLKTGLINEGAAVFFDGTRRNWMQLAKESRLAQAERRGFDDLVPLSIMALWEDWDLQTIDVSYPVAGAFVNMLIKKGGRDRFLEAFVDHSPEYFKAIYGDELSAWIKEFNIELNN